VSLPTPITCSRKQWQREVLSSAASLRVREGGGCQLSVVAALVQMDVKRSFAGWSVVMAVSMELQVAREVPEMWLFIMFGVFMSYRRGFPIVSTSVRRVRCDLGGARFRPSVIVRVVALGLAGSLLATPAVFAAPVQPSTLVKAPKPGDASADTAARQISDIARVASLQSPSRSVQPSPQGPAAEPTEGLVPTKVPRVKAPDAGGVPKIDVPAVRGFSVPELPNQPAVKAEFDESKSTEIVSKRKEFSKTFANADGTFSTVMSLEPVNFR
jgi:hypothetical protein